MKPDQLKRYGSLHELFLTTTAPPGGGHFAERAVDGRQQRLVAAGHVGRGDDDAGVAAFLPEGLGEREQERLGREVHRHDGARREGREGGDVEDPAAPAIEHPGEDALGEVDRGGAVDVDQLEFPVERRLVEEAVCPEAGVVDQDVEPSAVGSQRVTDPFALIGVGEVGGDGSAGSAVRLAQRLCQGVEPVRAPGDKDEVVAAGCELAGEFFANSARGAGDDSERARGVLADRGLHMREESA